MTTLRVLDIPAADAPAHARALEDMRDGHLDVLLVRGVFDRDAMARVAERLRRGEPAFERTPVYPPTSEFAAMEMLGLMIAPTELWPLGPELSRYRAHAARFRTACQVLFAGLTGFEQRVGELLATLGGRRVTGVPCFEDGACYTPATIRVMPEGTGASLHRDQYPRAVSYAHLRTLCDLSRQYSYYLPITLPDAGGELRIVHDATAVGASTLFTPGVGDLIAFPSSDFPHEVCRVRGAAPRTTIGGFFAWSAARDALWFWS